ERHRALLDARLLRQRIADDPRPVVLAEEEPRPRGRVRDEHDAVHVRLALVPVAAGREVDRLLRAERERALRGGVALERREQLLVEADQLELAEDPPVAAGRRLERLEPDERLPGGHVDADRVPTQLVAGARPHGADDVVRTLERQPEQVEPELRVAAREERDERLEGAAGHDLYRRGLRRRHRLVYESSRSHSMNIER